MLSVTDPKRLRRAIDRAYRVAERYRARGDADSAYWFETLADEAERRQHQCGPDRANVEASARIGGRAMIGPRHRFLDPGPPEPSAAERPVYPPSKGEMAERQKALSDELSKAKAETAELRYRLDTIARAAQTAITVLKPYADRKP